MSDSEWIVEWQESNSNLDDPLQRVPRYAIAKGKVLMSSRTYWLTNALRGSLNNGLRASCCFIQMFIMSVLSVLDFQRIRVAAYRFVQTQGPNAVAFFNILKASGMWLLRRVSILATVDERRGTEYLLTFSSVVG